MRTPRCPGRLRLAVFAALSAPAGLHAQEGPRPLTVALAASAGMQYDERPCTLAGREGTTPDTAVCLLFAGGADLALLWRGRIGGAIGLYSSSGQAVKTLQEAAIPDRISLPLSLEVRPLSFLAGAEAPTLTGRFLSGLALRVGPSLELVRTSSDSAPGLGFYFSMAGEVPLTSARRGAVSLRLQLQVTAAPLVSLNGGDVRSGRFDLCSDCPDLGERYHGYGAYAQTYLGLVYYP